MSWSSRGRYLPILRLADLCRPAPAGAVLARTGGVALSEAMASGKALAALTRLDVQNTDLDVEAAAAIVRSCLALPHLAHLDVSGVQVPARGVPTDVLLGAAVQLIHKSRAIRELVLSSYGFPVTQRSMAYLQNAINSSNDIERVAVVGFICVDESMEMSALVSQVSELRDVRNRRMRRTLQVAA